MLLSGAKAFCGGYRGTKMSAAAHPTRSVCWMSEISYGPDLMIGKPKRWSPVSSKSCGTSSAVRIEAVLRQARPQVPHPALKRQSIFELRFRSGCVSSSQILDASGCPRILTASFDGQVDEVLLHVSTCQVND